MGLLICLVIGTVIGWLVAAIQEIDEGIFLRMGIGLLGSLFGELVAKLFYGTTMSNFTWFSVLFSVAGALILLGIVSATLSRNSSRDGI